MVLCECQWVGCLPWALARGQWALGCPRDRCHLVTSCHLATRCLQGSSTCLQVSMGCRRATKGWATWRTKAPTALTRCLPPRTWCRNPPCPKAPATPRHRCPNTTPPTHHTLPIQAHTRPTLTPLLTSLRAGKTLISTSLKTSPPQQLSPRMLQ